MAKIRIKQKDEFTVTVRRGETRVEVTIFDQKPYEGFVRILDPNQITRTHPLRVIEDGQR